MSMLLPSRYRDSYPLPTLLRPPGPPGVRFENCRGCGSCLSTCPTGALTVSPTDGRATGRLQRSAPAVIRLNARRCIGCLECLEVCPANVFTATGGILSTSEYRSGDHD